MNFDAILKNLDTQGAIEENMLFLQRQTSLDFDDMLASISGGFAGGTAFGLFENSEEMALNLGFSVVSEEVLMTSTKLTGNT